MKADLTVTEPFFVTEIDHWIPADQIEELCRTYPDPFQGGRTMSMKTFIDGTHEAFHAFLAENKPWRDLIGHMSSTDFLKDLHAFSSEGLKQSRGAANPWKLDGKIVAGKSLLNRPIEISTEFQFSSMVPGNEITPHSDGRNKLVSVMVYFPQPGWKPEYGGGTDYYRPKNPEAAKRYWTRKINHIADFGEAGLKQFFDEMEVFHSSAFTPGRLAAFYKNTRTYHGVAPIRCPEGMRRNALIFNIKHDQDGG